SRWLIATSHCYFPHFEGCCNEPLNPSHRNLHSLPLKSTGEGTGTRLLEDGVGLVLVLRVLAHHPVEVACEAGDHHEGRAGIDECVAEGSRVLPGAGDDEREDQGRDAAED